MREKRREKMSEKRREKMSENLVSCSWLGLHGDEETSKDELLT